MSKPILTIDDVVFFSDAGNDMFFLEEYIKGNYIWNTEKNIIRKFDGSLADFLMAICGDGVVSKGRFPISSRCGPKVKIIYNE
jgi:hypothetical protein